MSNGFKQEIRDRMDQSTFAERTDMVLPVDNYALNRTPAENFANFGRPIIYEMVGRTARESREQGAVVWVPPETIDPAVSEMHVSEIVQGIGGGMVEGQTVQPNAPVFYDLHTHPIDSSAAFSDGDIRSMVGTILQYPDRVRDTLSENPIRRSFGLISQPIGYDSDQVVLKMVTATGGVLDLSIEQQRELTQDILSAWEERSVLDPIDEFFSQFGDFFTVSTEQITLPTTSDEVRFRSAIPDSVGDKEFGNAFAEGDLRDVLQGVEYV